ncbi:MAG: electron transport complex protein RnfC [Gammaproteobacteria bacterium]|nr:MAG: electron transport complex protein RnfC [Gammaproteobacteria bacterium]TND04426.1 MAG: electron transport complex protein RnfC [Gammaproteobacteria bacterium]
MSANLFHDGVDILHGQRRLWSFHGGVHPPQHKHESTNLPVIRAELPERLILPLHQHIGEPAEPIVQVGDKVLKGQMIGRAHEFLSAPVHASTSGTIVDIGEYAVPHPSGLNATCIVIEPDGEDRGLEHPRVGDYLQLAPSALRNLIREAGIVGLGGAGFPSYIKLNPGKLDGIDTLILNGIECEPYITCDDMLMREYPREIIAGLRVMQHALQARVCVLAIEDNKPEAFRALHDAALHEAGIEVILCPTIYPQGSEKQLIKVITGKEVPANGLAIHIGIVCHNVATALAVHHAVEHGRPLVSRYVTVTGAGVSQPRNLDVAFGTPVRDLIIQCGGDPAAVKRLIMGGPMMGYALHSHAVPVIKTTNCIIAATEADIVPPRPVMPCIRCGACADACPVMLLPQQLYWYAHTNDLDKVQEYNLFDCIECGCCSYVCPSNIPLVQYYRYAKGAIWTKEREHEQADIARQRHEFRLDRLAREKAEREARRRLKKASLAKNQDKTPHTEEAVDND